jgi:hypothetical protein
MADKPNTTVRECLEQQAERKNAGHDLHLPEDETAPEAHKRDADVCGLLHERGKQAFRFEMKPHTQE